MKGLLSMLFTLILIAVCTGCTGATNSNSENTSTDTSNTDKTVSTTVDRSEIIGIWWIIAENVVREVQADHDKLLLTFRYDFRDDGSFRQFNPANNTLKASGIWEFDGKDVVISIDNKAWGTMELQRNKLGNILVWRLYDGAVIYHLAKE